MPNNDIYVPSSELVVRDIKLIINRLERLSTDSKFAHLASGYRGCLLRSLEKLNKQPNLSTEEFMYLNKIMDECFDILFAAAKEIIR